MGLSFQESRNWLLYFHFFLLPRAGGESAMLDAQDMGCGHHSGSAPPGSVCRLVLASALAQLIPEKRVPYPGVSLDAIVSYANTFERYQ